MTSSFGPTQQRDRVVAILQSWRSWFANLHPKTLAIVAQTTFSLAVLIPLLLVCIYNWDEVRVPELIFGVGLLVLATVSVTLLKSTRLPQHLELVLALIDLMGLGVIRWATLPEGAQLSSLALGPALWLVVRYRMPGVVLGTVTILLSISVPSMLAISDPRLADVARFAVLPLTFVMISVLVLVLFERLSHQHREIRRGERLLKGVINHLNVGVLVLDVEGHDVLMNPAQRSLHGLVSPVGSADPTEAGHLLFNINGEPLPAEARPAHRIISGETFDDEVVLAGPPGEDQRILKVTSRIVGSQESGVEARIVIFDDISDSYRAQRAQREIIATVSHELRTPLTSIVGYADLVSEELDNLPPEDGRILAEFLSVIERNAQKLLLRVEDLLLQQQTQNGMLKLQKQVFSLADIAREVVQGQRAAAAQRNIYLSLAIAAEPEVRADSQRIIQVMDNILSNALKYTPIGGEVTVHIDCLQGTGVTVPEAVFAVTDTGPGLSPEEAEQVFKPFFRTPSASQYAEGAGLGLSVSKGLVESHHGRVHIDTEIGQGSTFSVYLPLHEEYML